MSLTEEGIVLSAGRPPDISPPFIRADINIEELKKEKNASPTLSREQREQAVIVHSLIWFPNKQQTRVQILPP